jgi:hypothetical protein
MAGCGDTGFIFEVTGPSGVTSTHAGISSLELIMARQSWCERWVEDTTASHAKGNVAGRDLSKSPYDFLVRPIQMTDINAPVVTVVLARAADGRVVGEAGFGALKWKPGDVRKYAHRVELLSRGSQPGGPQYVAADGCVCLPGQPWMGTGNGAGCDNDVITSFDRLTDRKQCELPAGHAFPSPACDGQLYPGESADRDLPCFAVAGGQCRIGTRHCQDDGGFAYSDECVPGDQDPVVAGALCDAYLACEQTACGDVLGCLTATVATEAHTCTLRISPTLTGGAIHPCADGRWEAKLPSPQTGCNASILDGTSQPPFSLGFRVSGQTDLQTVTDACPITLAVDKVDASQLDEVPYAHDFFVTIGDKLIKIHMDVLVGCADGVPSLVCK